MPSGTGTQSCGIGPGDLYEYIAHPDRPTGKIKSVDFHAGRAHIEWDDPQLIPHVQDFSLHSFFDGTLVPYLPIGDANEWLDWMGAFDGYSWTKVKCECGTSKTMGADDDPMFHSDYCPIYKEWKAKQKGGS